MRLRVKVITAALLISLLAVYAYALDYPHFGPNSIGCDSCHFVTGGEPSLLPPWTSHVPQDIDDTAFNTLCWSCHNDIESPYMKTHSSLQTDNGYGDWTIECKDCHNPHYQKQFKTYGSSSSIYEGTISSVNATTLTETGAGWGTDQYKDYVVYPNTSKNKYSYKILSNTTDTLTVGGPINLTYAGAGNTFAIVYGNLVESTITTPNSGDKTVRFYRQTGNKSFADADGTYDGVCEVCHTQTLYHRNNTTGNHTHNTDKRCSLCHKHLAGFKGVGCDSCHGYPPTVDAATGGPDGLVNSPGVTNSATAGAHDKHVNTKLLQCEVCHYTSVGEGGQHNNGAPQDITIGFRLFDGAYLGGIYDGQAGVNYDSSEVNTVVISGGTKTCDNIYCHGTLPNGTVWGAGQDTTPAWDGSVTCSSCHDAGGSSSGLSGKHAKHTDASRHAIDCEKCHNNTATGSTAIKTESYHANNTKDIAFSVSGTFDSDTKSCTSTYCHSDARGGAPNVAVEFDGSMTMACDSCHNGRPGTDTLEMSSNGHNRLVSTNWVRQYPCDYCHDATVDNSLNIKDYSKHANETKDVAMKSTWYISGEADPTYDSGTKTCDNVYCHSDGTTTSPDIKPVAWTDGSMSCNSCHGHTPGTCTDCHSDGITAWAAGEEWKSAMPMYTNAGAGASKANTHQRHLLTEFSCQKCHNKTIKNGDCDTCHTDGMPPGDMGEVEHIDPDYHVNKVKDIDFLGGGTFNQVDKTCSSTTCHTGADPQWGDSVNGAVICLECHGTTGNDVDDYTPNNDTRAKINTVEFADTGHGRLAASGNYESGNPPADFPGNACWYCHDNSVLHNTTTNPYRLRLHDQFNNRFDKECVFCHMEGLDAECFACHNDSGSMAPQLADISSPEDHTGYTDELTSCVTVCHPDDANRHNVSAGDWNSSQKADVKNQYVMMGVCLVCHDDDSNGKCTSCHTGPQYALGFNPGSGFVTGTTKATSTHFGYKHYAAYELDGTWKGGKFCWDCHDPHGDSNIYMIQDKVATETDGTYGTPIATRDVVFTRALNGMDYAKSSSPYNGICNVCHTESNMHYRNDYGNGHNAGRKCTNCHEHRFSDSHASGKACNSCHGNRPIARHTAFGLPRDCTKCHDGVVFGRIDIIGQLTTSNSHHIQGVTPTNKHCYACHWEATAEGLIDLTYHSGYNYKTNASVKDDPVNLVIWGPGTRPTTYTEGTTGVAYDKTQIGTANERTEFAQITQMCLSCHSDQNNDTQPFNIVDPDNGDCKTPRQYAWDRTSIAARYSQTGTTTWGKYTGTSNAAKKDITKSFSAHGNAVNNAGGFNASTGLDGTITDTRAGTENVQCYDCHNSHGSKAVGVTSSYVTFNGTYNGANLKETQAGKGGYILSYQPKSGGGAVNPYNEGAAICFDCHESANSGTMTSAGKFSPWGYNGTFGATVPIFGYKDTPKFGLGTSASLTRYSYRSSKAVLGGHLNASSDLVGLDGTPGTGDENEGSINGLCTPCHDPHGVSPRLGANQAYAVPLLKGTWMTSPYKEDAPRPGASSGSLGSKGNQWPPTRPYIYDDQKTFGGSNRIGEDDTQFAGLCLRCHPKDNLTDGTNNNGAWKSLDRIHESVKGWGDNAQHSYPCAKCHQAHNSGLPRLVQTNCLDYNHRGNSVSGGNRGYGSKGSYPKGRNKKGQNCHPTGSYPDNRWNNVTQW